MKKYFTKSILFFIMITLFFTVGLFAQEADEIVTEEETVATYADIAPVFF